MNINESVKWDEGIYLIRRNDKVEGGRDGAANIQATQLANRTAYLKVLLEGSIDFKNLTFFRTDDDPDGTIAGIAATTEGQLFRVAQGVSAETSFIYYVNKKSVAEAIANLPSNRAVEVVKS
ncbi:TPA: SGNH/GDSL hydrolase family protein, partial [Klebsiella pneumoniae]|nr:SGNH/GDSL hydrolase family protein [Klebsiella pneumoniae]